MRPSYFRAALLAAFTLASATAAEAQSTATLTVSPTVAPPTGTLTAQGSGFGASETVKIDFGSTELQTVTADSNGGWGPVPVTVPQTAVPGPYSLVAIGETSHESARKQVVVRTDWPMGGFDLARSHYNPYENVLNVANAPSLAPLWSVTAGGWVRASPVEASGIAYIGTQHNNVQAYNASTGVRSWTQRLGGSSAINSTAAIVSGALYVGSTNGTLYAFNAANGAQLWAVPTGGEISNSPLEVDNLVYSVSLATGERATLYAYAASNGAVVWSQYLGNVPAGYGKNGPTLGNGEVLTPYSIFSSPSYADGLLYIGSGDGYVYAFNATTGAQVWAAQTNNWVNATPTVDSGTVYCGSWDGNFYAWSAQTGALLWQVPLNGVIESSAAVANGVVYVGSADHSLYALDAATGATLWTATTDDVIGASPAVANGVVYIGSFDDGMYALNAATGAKLWSHATTFFIEASASVVNGILYVASMDGSFAAFSVNGVPPP